VIGWPIEMASSFPIITVTTRAWKMWRLPMSTSEEHKPF